MVVRFFLLRKQHAFSNLCSAVRSFKYCSQRTQRKRQFEKHLRRHQILGNVRDRKLFPQPLI